MALIFGTAFNDNNTFNFSRFRRSLVGTNLNDTIRGFGGNDVLIGNGGNDILDGGFGNDFMNGGFGNDIYIVNSPGDRAVENAGGIDTVRSSVSHTLSANLENLVLTGFAVTGNGNAKANRITGNSRGNVLRGFAGNDTLSGGSGNDVLIGGFGRDVLIDGQGRDRFLYFNRFESPAGFFRRDFITDLDRGFDRIDLSPIDANLRRAGNQRFNFIGTRRFTGSGTGQVRYFRSGSNAIVQVDVQGDGNAIAEMEIQVGGTTFLTSRDFIL